jgi:hypothetical protein
MIKRNKAAFRTTHRQIPLLKFFVLNKGGLSFFHVSLNEKLAAKANTTIHILNLHAITMTNCSLYL